MNNPNVSHVLNDVNPVLKGSQAFLRYLQNRSLNFQISRRILCTSNAEALEYLRRFGLDHDDPNKPISADAVAEFFGVSDRYVSYLFVSRTGLSGSTAPKAVFGRGGRGKRTSYSPAAVLAVVPVATCGRSIPRFARLERIAKDINRGGYEALDRVPNDPMNPRITSLVRAQPSDPTIQKITIANGITWSPEDGVSVSQQFAESMANDVKAAIMSALVEALGK